MGTDPDAQVAEVVDALVALCERRRLHRKVIAERMGVSNSVVYSFDGHRFAPKFSTMLRYAEAAGARVHVTVTTPEGAVAPETVTPLGESTQLSQVQAALASVRKAQQRTFEQVAQTMGRSAATVLKVATQENLQVSTVLRYAEALGARVEFSVHLAPGEPEVDPTSRDRPRPAAPAKLDPTVVQALQQRLEGPSLQDHAHRVAELVDALVAMRHEQQLSETTVRTRMGGNTTSVDRVELGRGERKYALLLRYAYAIGARVHVTVTTCDGTRAPETPPEDSTRLSQVQAALIATRKAQGLDYPHIAKALGFTAKDIPRMEQQQDQLLSTLYRHAVVLGARLDFTIHPAPDTSEKAGKSAGDPGWQTITERRADQIAEDLMHRIDAGEWAPGDYLPVRSTLYGEYACSTKPLSEALSTLHTLGYVTLRHGERTQVRDRSGDLDLPTALAEVKTQLAEIRDDTDDTTATRLRGLHQRLDQLTNAAQEQQERLLEPLTPEMRNRHASPLTRIAGKMMKPNQGQGRQR